MLKVWHPDLHKHDPEKHAVAIQRVTELKRAYEAIAEELEKPYKLLELKYGATQAEIVQAFESLKEIYNPAYFTDNPDLCKKVEFKLDEVTKAYEQLSRGIKFDASAPQPQKNTGVNQAPATDKSNAPPPQQQTAQNATSSQNTRHSSFDSDSSDKSCAIWNPNAAANWSLIFSPAFGSYLQMLNWQALGQPDRASSAKIWFYISLCVLMLYVYIGVTVRNPHASDGMAKAIGFLYLIIWYFTYARSQGKFVKEKLGENYTRKSWGKPLLIGVAAMFGYLALAFIIGLIASV